eukprot:GFKZ01015535.1.p1 GENE.GFKZ01015535.1~~GFKZ01015535.1.p1  ORF type:complete len:842 (-),score=93.72 GFKZ01015535.1:776-3301(-)
MLRQFARSRCAFRLFSPLRHSTSVSSDKPLNPIRRSPTEGKSWVTLHPHLTPTSTCPPLSQLRSRARALRLSGNPRAAHSLLQHSSILNSTETPDLLEYLLSLLHADHFTSPRHRLNPMLHALQVSPADKPRPVFNVILTACLKEASLVSDNSSAKRDLILTAALQVWDQLIHTTSSPGKKNVALIYRILGLCNDLPSARRIRRQIHDPILEHLPSANPPPTSSEEAIAAFVLCLGQCGRASEAEALYFSPLNAVHRTSDKVLVALFQAFVAARRISKAESLISMFGSGFLTLSSCNAFIKQCASLRMHETALAFLERMTRSAQTHFPPPSARTYNLLLRGLSAGSGAEDRDVAADRTMAVVEEMKRQGIEPTTVTYNTVIRSLVFRDQIREAFDLYRTMQAPNRITFSHLMQGAANIADLRLANEVYASLVEARERPNYGFCKSYLETVARVQGIDVAFTEAVRISEELGEVLVFGDVSSQEVIRMALISACGKVGDLSAAFDVLKLELKGQEGSPGVLAPLYVATVLMQVCLRCSEPGKALEVFYSLKAASLTPNFEVYESLIYGLSSYVRATGSHYTSVDDSYTGAFEQCDGDEGSLQGLPKVDTRSQGAGLEVRRSDDEGGGHSGHEHLEFSAKDALSTAVELLCEMHSSKQARTARQAAYVYNALITAAAEMADLDLALQIFNKMSVQNNRDVVYFSADSIAERGPARTKQEFRRGELHERLATLASTGMFENGFEFPAATVGTYNSVIDAAWRSGEPWFSFQVFEMMQTDRITEPNAATLSLLADIALSEASRLGTERLRMILRELDKIKILSKEVSRKRVRLRQKIVAMRWSEN